MKRLILYFSLFLTYHAFQAQQFQRELDSILQILQERELFHGQILIAEKDSILFNKNYGYTDEYNKETPITDTTAFKVYSVGKSMTALAVYLLHEKGKLDIDDPITEYFPELPYPDLRIRSLMTMTSGLPRFMVTALKYADTTEIMDNEKIIRMVSEFEPPAGPENEDYFYNNSNYILLGSLIERVSGLRYAEFMKKELFEPLGMDHTFDGTFKELNFLSSEKINANNFYQTFGAGSIYTTALDLYKYARALRLSQLIPESYRKEAFDPVILKSGDTSYYGFGWKINDSKSEKEIYHVGDGTDMRASLQFWPEKDKIMIYIHPYSNQYHQEVYWLIRNIWENKAYDLPQKIKLHEIDKDLYQKYIGAYESPNFGKIHVSTEDGKLFLRPDPIPGKEELIPSSDTTFYFRNQNVHWRFYLNKDGGVEALGLKDNPDFKGFKIREKD